MLPIHYSLLLYGVMQYSMYRTLIGVQNTYNINSKHDPTCAWLTWNLQGFFRLYSGVAQETPVNEHDDAQSLLSIVHMRFEL